MLQVDQSTAGARAQGLKLPSGLGDWVSEEAHIKYVDRTVPVVLRHGTGAPTTDTVELDRKANGQLRHSSTSLFKDRALKILAFPEQLNPKQPTATLYALQEWEGCVIEIRARDIVARLIDLTAGSTNEEEEAVIPFEEISDNDFVKMSLGSIFHWVIGYERSSSGTKKRVSQIVFRDLPAFTRADLQSGEAWAHRVIRLLRP